MSALQRGGTAQSLRPVTIKQLRDATQAHADAEWRIDDIEIGPVSHSLSYESWRVLTNYKITVVALVRTVTPQTTNCLYELDDGTGQMQARHWVDAAQVIDDDGIKYIFLFYIGPFLTILQRVDLRSRYGQSEGIRKQQVHQRDT